MAKLTVWEVDVSLRRTPDQVWSTDKVSASTIEQACRKALSMNKMKGTGMFVSKAARLYTLNT